jgi:hypothetical protein
LNDEDDTDPANNTFDTVADSDKAFIAEALSQDGQALAPTSAYSWKWIWKIDKPNVIATTSFIGFIDTGEKQLVRAQEGITDDSAVLHATASSTTISPSFSSFTEEGSADVYVFTCENPWPAVGNDGLWHPWADDQSNCLSGSGDCQNVNYKLYYCRDAGKSGTADDLPAISNNTITRGKNFICSYGTNIGKACSKASDCPGSVCKQILKESFFFRESAQ